MMLHATIQADIFRETIDAVSALVNECRLHLTADGIRTITVDTSNVAIVSMELSASAFESYALSVESAEIGFAIGQIVSVMGMVGKTDFISLDLDDSGKKLKLSFGGYEYSIVLLDTKTIKKDPNTPNLNLPVTFEIAGVMFNDAIKASRMVSDMISLSVSGASRICTMNAEGECSNTIKREFSGGDVHYITCADARSLFSLDYLKDMGKSISRAKKVQIHLGNDKPLQISFEYADGKGKIGYLLAPRLL